MPLQLLQDIDVPLNAGSSIHSRFYDLFIHKVVSLALCQMVKVFLESYVMLNKKELHSPCMKDELLHSLQIPSQSLLQRAIQIRISAIIVIAGVIRAILWEGKVPETRLAVRRLDCLKLYLILLHRFHLFPSARRDYLGLRHLFLWRTANSNLLRCCRPKIRLFMIELFCFAPMLNNRTSLLLLVFGTLFRDLMKLKFEILEAMVLFIECLSLIKLILLPSDMPS